MRNAKKWKSELQSIEFPNCEKYSDNGLLKIIYQDVPERLNLLRWIALKIGDEDPAISSMTIYDIGRFFSERGILNKRLEKDFVQASCSEKLQEKTWKILFSYTRLHKFLHPGTPDRVGIQNKFSELLKSDERLSILRREPSVTIEEVESEIGDGELDRIVKKEVHDIEEEIKSTDVLSTESGSEQFQKITQKKTKRVFNPFSLLEDSHNLPSSNEIYEKPREERVLRRRTPLFDSPQIEDIKLLGEESGLKESATGSVTSRNEEELNMENSSPKKEWFKENEVVPRIFVMPGSPPLGHLDPTKIKIVPEDSAPPINLDGSPSQNHSHWEYRIYDIKKTPHFPMPFEQFEGAGRFAHIGGGDG